MSLPQEVVNEVFQVIEGGNVIGQTAEIIQFPSDNGQNVYNVVQKTYQGTNGTGFNYWVVAFETLVGETVMAVSAGAAILTLPLAGSAGAVAAIGAALGLTTGYVLYGLSPEFWDSVAQDLMDAGETIGGKLVTFINENGNMTFSQNAIEIIKNRFLEYGSFDSDLVAELADEDFSELLYKDLLKNPTPLYGSIFGVYDETIGIAEHFTAHGCYLLALPNTVDNGVRIICAISNQDNSYYTHDYSSTYPTVNRTLDYSIEVDGHTYYHSLGGNVDSTKTSIQSSTVGNYTQFGQDQIADLIRVIFGGNINQDEGRIQDGAVLPGMDPFTTTYPDWFPWEFPIIDPDGTHQQLPDRFPIEYPEILPDIEPYQDPAQNPEPGTENNPDEVIETIQDPDNDPRGHTDDEEETAEDPDPQPSDPDPIPEDPEGDTEPDPIDPNPDPIPTPIIPIPPLPDSISSNKLFTVYNPTSSQLDALGGYLWDASIIAAIRDIWQDPLDGIISLMQVYATPNTGGNKNIILGFLDTGISSRVVSNQFVTVDCGSVEIKERKKNATDYAPYTSIHLYLPFIGIVELDSNECMDSVISVTYKVDVYTGTCLAQVSVDRETDMPNDPILYTFNGNCSQQIPLTSGNSTGVLSALLAGISAGVSIASGGGLSTVAGYHLAGSSLTHEMMHVSHSGNISANAGIMGQKKPYVIIGRRHCYDANNYNSFYGFPANKTVILGNHNGYAKVKKCWIKTKATKQEYEEIMRILEEDGIFL